MPDIGRPDDTLRAIALHLQASLASEAALN